MPCNNKFLKRYFSVIVGQVRRCSENGVIQDYDLKVRDIFHNLKKKFNQENRILKDIIKGSWLDTELTILPKFDVIPADCLTTKLKYAKH